MKSYILAQRYVQAFRNSLKDGEVVSALDELLEVIHSVVMNDTAFKALKSPVLSKSKKVSFFQSVVKKSSNPTKLGSLFELLIQKKRLNILPYMIQPLQHVISGLNGKIEVSVESASTFTKGDESVLSKYLSDVTQKDVYLKVEENPEILAGFRAYLGDTVYDASLQNAINKLKQTFN